MVVPGKPFQPSIMFVGEAEARAFPYLSDAPLKGRFMALPTNIRLGWKGLPGKNAPANYEKL